MRRAWKNSNILQRVTKFNKCRSVSTWSPLATAFNHRPRMKLNFSLLKDSTGLFDKKELTGFEGFYSMQQKTISHSNDLIDEAISKNRTRPMVDIFDELSNTLCKVADLSEFIRIAHPNSHFRQAAEDACISISGVVEKLNTHRPLYDALKDSLTAGNSGDKHVAELFLFDFEQSGIHLDTGPRQRVVTLNDCILQIGQRFMAASTSARNIPKDFVPQNLRQAFGKEETLVISGLNMDSSDERIRELAYRIYLAPDPVQEIGLRNLLSARHEMAQLCGFRSYADRAIKASTMETAENVSKFLDILSEKLKSRAQKDFDLMLQMKQGDDPNAKDLGPWDTPYFGHNAKMKWLNVAGFEYTPYFSLGTCMDGFNLLMQSLYGISLQHEELQPGEVWSPDVYKLGVVHESEGLLGHIYCDFYERPHKPHQDCHFTIQGGKLLPDGTYQNPIVVVMLSLGSGSWGGPALLSPGSVDNLFHEMGHAMHSMLGRTRHQHVAGTRCPTDLAEVPSVLMEYFAGDPRVLKLFAKHFQTQQPMPDKMLQRLCASKHVFGPSDMQQQVFYSVLDQRYHGENFSEDVSTTEILKEVQNQYFGLPYVDNTAWQHRFSHLVGYGAKYYSYLISRAVAWSTWRNGFISDPLSRAAGERFRNGILKHGGSKPPQSLLSEYLAPQKITPESLAQALADELDYHKDHIDLFKTVCEKQSINN